MEHKGKNESKESDKALEYYRLYSDNNKLPKYFCGTFDEAGTSHTQPIPIIRIEDKGPVEVDEDKGRNPSPTSSVTSNRKLEWDYGADIGYENIGNKSLYKSLSLPVLNVAECGQNVSSESKESQVKRGDSEDDNKSYKSSASGKLSQQIESCEQKSGGVKLVNKCADGNESVSVNLLVHVDSAGSDEQKSEDKKYSDNQNSSSDNKSEGGKEVCNKEILQYIKARVGLPVAHSTPFNKLEISETIAFQIKGESSSDKKHYFSKDTVSESSNNCKQSYTSSDSSNLIKNKILLDKKSSSSERSSNSDEIKIITINSSSDSNQALIETSGIKVVSIESSSDSNLGRELSTNKIETTTSSSESNLSEKNKLIPLYDLQSKSLERHVDLYTPKIFKEKKVQNIKNLIDNAEKCVQVGLENEKLLKDKKFALAPTCFYYEIKEPESEFKIGRDESRETSKLVPDTSNLESNNKINFEKTECPEGVQLSDKESSDYGKAIFHSETDSINSKSKSNENYFSAHQLNIKDNKPHLSSDTKLKSNDPKYQTGDQNLKDSESQLKPGSFYNQNLKNKNVTLESSETKNKYRDKKIKNLILTKPIYVECLDPMNEKIHQTSIYIDSLDPLHSKQVIRPENVFVDSLEPLNLKNKIEPVSSIENMEPMNFKHKFTQSINYEECLDPLNSNDKNPQTSFLVECLDPFQLRDKNIQTSSENISIGIQTERSLDKSKKKHQSVLYMLHSQNEHYNTNSSGQTNSNAIFSDCDSFEFLNGSECESNKAVNDYHLKKLKRSAVKSDLTNLTSNSSSSKENYLSDLLSQQVSGEVDKKLELLQKLYKSKKYDKETKKYYLRKVLKSILNNQSSEDNSDCSEKITPNIAAKKEGILKSFENVCSDDNSNKVQDENRLVMNSNKDVDKHQKLRKDKVESNELRYKEKSKKDVHNSDIETSGENGHKYLDTQKIRENQKAKVKQFQIFMTDQHRNSDLDPKTVRRNLLQDKNSVSNENYDTENLRKQQYCSDSSRLIHLKTNVPWVPQIAPQKEERNNHISKSSSSIDSKSVDLKQRTHVFNFVSSPKKSSSHLRRTVSNLSPKKSVLSHMRKARSTSPKKLSSNVKNTCIDENVNLPHGRTESTSTMEKSSGIDKGDKRDSNWKENKTLSEQILEMSNRKLSSGDSAESANDELLFFAKREHENQLSWINNEIEHLVKLKDLLEKREKKSAVDKTSKNVEKNKIKTSSDKVVENKFKSSDTKKSTAIYMITTERGGGKGEDGVPIRSSIIRNGDISQTKFVVSNDKGTTAYKVHELQTGSLSSSSTSSGKVGKNVPIREDSIIPQILGNEKKSESDGHDSDSHRTCQCRPKSPHSQNSQNGKCDCKIKATSPVNSKEFYLWQNRFKEVDSVILEDNSSQRSFKSNLNSESQKVNYGAAVLISSSIKPSVTNPGDSVRRLVLEIPIDCKEKPSQVSKEVEVKYSKEVQTSKTLLQSNIESTTSSESSISSSSSTDGSFVLCSCCRKLIAASESSVAIDSELYTNISPPPIFCQPCFTESKKQTINPQSPYFQQPQHRCNCYNANVNNNINNGNFNANMNNGTFNRNVGNFINNNNAVDPDTITKIRRTLKELEELEEREKYCQCLNSKFSKLGDDVCTMCKCKGKNSKGSKKPVAYLLTFEPGDIESPKVKQKVRSLEEVRIKVPSSHKSRRKKSEGDKMKEDKDEGNHKKHKNSKHKMKKTLQEYLESNHPTFVKAAEERRKCMIDLAYMREQRCEKYKQLLALTNGIPMQKSNYSNIHQKRLFTSKEMKNMTAKKYKKLPEVQQKLVENRTKQIKKANRLLADIFNKKLRERVLLGNPNISASASVINLM